MFGLHGNIRNPFWTLSLPLSSLSLLSLSSLSLSLDITPHFESSSLLLHSLMRHARSELRFFPPSSSHARMERNAPNGFEFFKAKRVLQGMIKRPLNQSMESEKSMINQVFGTFGPMHTTKFSGPARVPGNRQTFFTAVFALAKKSPQTTQYTKALAFPRPTVSDYSFLLPAQQQCIGFGGDCDNNNSSSSYI